MIDHASEMAAFVRVVDAKGFSAAAPALGLTPSAVSKLVTRLEARLGVRLLQRTTRALSLTQEGEAFYESARRIVDEIETLESRIVDGRGTPQGLLRVTTSLAFATHQLAPVLAEFLARHPAIQFALLPTDRRRRHGRGGRRCRHPHRAAGRHQLHGAPHRRGQTGDLRLARLSRASWHAAASGGSAAPPMHPVARAGLSQSLVLLASTARCARSKSAAGSPSTRATRRLQLALQGIGIVRLTRLTVAQAVRAGRLVSLLPEFSAEQPLPINAVYPHRRHLAPKVPAFVDFLIEKFTPPPWNI